jgi:primase-polymerase (primpol)-like protein
MLNNNPTAQEPATTLPNASAGGGSLFHNIPDEMKAYDQWVVYKLVERPGQKPTKIPLQAKNGKNADVTNPEHWSTFAQAVAVASRVSGIG